MRRGHWPRAPLLIALICVTSPSRANGSALSLEYDADASCPDQDAFSALVLEKLAANGVEESSDARPQIAAHIHAAGAGFVGQLELRRSDASNYDREVTGASCEEVANALAFVLALALGAKDATAPSDVPASPTVVEPPAAPPPVPSVNPPPMPSPPPPLLPHELVAPARRSRWRLGVGEQVGERSGLGAPTFVGAAFLEARRVAVSPFGFTFRAGFATAQTATHGDLNGTTEFSWWAGNLEACPLRLRVLGPLALLPCAVVDVGRLHVNGNPSSPGSSSGKASRLWLDALAVARLELSLSRWLSLEAQGDLIVPFSRYQFEFKNTDAPTYPVPALAWGAFAGLAGHFL
jgi:hypothetical protein